MNLLRLFVIILAAAMVACSAAPANEDGELPEDLATLKMMRSELQKELRSGQVRLEEIEARIAELDPGAERVKKLVTTRQVELVDFKKFATFQGAVQSKDLVSVSSEAPGRLITVTVDEGQPVNRGQLIATIDMQGTEKQRDEIETQLQLARDIFERQKRLWDQNIGSEVQYLEAKNGVDRLEKSLATIDEQLSKSSIYAPLSGVVDVVNLKSGEMAQPGAPIVTILDTRNLKVVADLPESYLGQVHQGEEIHVRFPALDREEALKVTMIGRKIDPANRTFKVEADVSAGKDGLIKPNLLSEVKITDHIEPNVVVVAQELIQEEVGGRKFMMVVDEGPEGPVAKKTYVRTGMTYEGDVIVTSGIDVGQNIIVEGARGLTSGEPLEIVQNEIASDGE